MESNTVKYVFCLLLCTIFIGVQGSLHAKVKYVHGPDVPKGETLLCRYPKDFEAIREEVDLSTQQRGDLRCELKHYLEYQRPCDFRKVLRYKLVTITLKGQFVSLEHSLTFFTP